MPAVDAIETDFRVRILVTSVVFGPGKPHGVALARMVRIRRPGTRVVFVAPAGYEPHPEGTRCFTADAAQSRYSDSDGQSPLGLTRLSDLSRKECHRPNHS